MRHQLSSGGFEVTTLEKAVGLPRIVRDSVGVQRIDERREAFIHGVPPTGLELSLSK